MGKRVLLNLVLCLLFLRGSAVSDTLYLNKDFRDGYGTQSDVYLWRFINGDNPAYATREWNDDAAPLVKPSLDPSNNLYGQLQGGVGWFRVWIKADKDMIDKSLAFGFTGYGLMDVFMDGDSLASLPPRKNGDSKNVKLDNHPVFFSLTDTMPHLIAVRYENRNASESLDTQWGFDAQLKHSGDLFRQNMGSLKTVSVLILPTAGTFATLFVIHILMFFFYRKDISNLYFALFNLGITVFFSTTYVGLAYDADIDQSFFSAILITVSCVLSCYSISAFCTYLFSKRKLFIRIIGVLSALMAVITVFFYNSAEYTTYIELGLAVLAIITSVYVVVIFISAMLKKVQGSSILGAGILFTIFFVFSMLFAVAFNGGYLTTDNTLLSILLVITGILAVFSIPLSISSFLAWRYAATSRNLQRQLVNVAALSEQTIRQEKEKQHILENQKAGLEKEVAIRTEEIIREKQKSDDLLLNILPQEIAEELKLKGESKAQLYDETSVLFTDLVDFTAISEKLGVEELLNELNVNFTAFDGIMEKYGLEKIKTIGDAYLAVSGLPATDPLHAQNTVKAALEILDFVERRKKQVTYALDIRIGINSGPLIAGIIGVKKFAYDIWGDTVNVAARMEKNSLPGKINISEDTYRLVKNDFECTYRGKIDVKGKGEMNMYFIEKPPVA